ncbi:MAG: xanthine dehydrogenase family protein molybdopterin-binding subunit [Planctomycetota bacterium]|jgi:CO/xanthine dehydrogenase Mo-binding subunit
MKTFVAGTPVVRKDALEKAAGRARYLDDIHLKGQLFGAVARAPVPSATLRRVDTEAALDVEGVVAVLSASDIPGKNRIPLIHDDYPFLAEKEIRFHGQPVALVAAQTPEAARMGAARVTVQAQERPPLLDIREAQKRNAPKIGEKNNIFARHRIRKGNAPGALAKAFASVKGIFETGTQIHAYLEPQGMLALPGDGMTVMGSMQCPFYVRDAVAAVLNLPKARVRIVQTPTGGGFGGKEDVPSIVAGHAALLANALGRPVKIVYTREEDFISMSRRHPSRITIQYGCNRKGILSAARVRVELNAGAYATLSPIVLWRASVHAPGPYAIPNVEVDALAVATNTAPCGAFRGFGQPQVAFANESLIDELARKIEMDPVKFRLQNALKSGSRTATSQVLRGKVGLADTLRAASKGRKERKKSPGGESESPARLRGTGFASSFYGVGLGAGGKHLDRAGAFVQVTADGSTLVAVGNTEMGQGARTVLSQIAAEALNAPLDLVDVTACDTSRVPDSGPTVASRTTVMSGNAVLDACKSLRRTLMKAASDLLGVKPASVVAEGGEFKTKRGKKKVRFDQAAAHAHALRESLASQGWFRTEGTSFDPKTGKGDAYPAYTFSTHRAEVVVDGETGEVRVLGVHSFHDIGTVINPAEARGQCMGGIVQGMGWALMENLVLEKGTVVFPGFGGYAVPGFSDAPEMSATFVKGFYPGGPFGAKGLGEPSLIAVPAAILNAVADATGRRIRRIPATPEVVLDALEGRP